MMDDLDRWFADRLVRVRLRLDALDDDRAANHRKARDAESHEQRGPVQWYVGVFGVGHGCPTGVRPIDEAPSFYTKLVQ